MGAKKVVIYEPLQAHQTLIRHNLRQNNISAEIHIEGIGEKDGKQVVSFERIDMGFGVNSKGTKKTEIVLRNVSEVISLSKAEVAKFDCEGSEICLTTVPDEVLRKINYYIIETHSDAIKKQ